MEVSALKRNSSRIEAGEWVGDIPEMGDLKLRVRGMQSTIYTTTYARLARAVERKDRDRSGALLPAVNILVLGQALYESVLFDWDGLTNEGEPFLYDAATALEWLTNPDFRNFADAVVWAARVVDNIRTDIKEDLEKNFEKPLNGNSSSAQSMNG